MRLGGLRCDGEVRRKLSAVLSCVGLVAMAVAMRPLRAQRAETRPGGATVHGQVRDGGGATLSGARITRDGSTASVESDEAGLFHLPGVPAGTVTLVARRIGFAAETLAVRVPGAGAVAVEMTLQRLAMPLEAVVVHGRRELRGPLAGFYRRMERGEGRYFTAEQIERRGVMSLSDLLRGIPGVQIQSRRGIQSIRIRGSSVAPLVWLDGVSMSAGEVDLDAFDPRRFAGVELYSGPATVPVEFSDSRRISTSGGTIVLWTREGETAGARRKRGAPSPALLVIGMLDRGEVYTADKVDTPARPLSEHAEVPVYPDSLYAVRVRGRIEVEFVVDEAGRVRRETFGVVSTSHLALVAPVRRSILQSVFIPATRAGRSVSVLVQQPIDFLPDSGAVVRKPKD